MDLESRKAGRRLADQDAGERGHPHSHNVSGRGSASNARHTKNTPASRSRPTKLRHDCPSASPDEELFPVRALVLLRPCNLSPPSSPFVAEVSHPDPHLSPSASIYFAADVSLLLTDSFKPRDARMS